MSWCRRAPWLGWRVQHVNAEHRYSAAADDHLAMFTAPWVEEKGEVDAETVSVGDDLVQVASGWCLAPWLVLRIVDGGRLPVLVKLDQICAGGHP